MNNISRAGLREWWMQLVALDACRTTSPVISEVESFTVKTEPLIDKLPYTLFLPTFWGHEILLLGVTEEDISQWSWWAKILGSHLEFNSCGNIPLKISHHMQCSTGYTHHLSKVWAHALSDAHIVSDIHWHPKFIHQSLHKVGVTTFTCQVYSTPTILQVCGTSHDTVDKETENWLIPYFIHHILVHFVLCEQLTDNSFMAIPTS